MTDFNTPPGVSARDIPGQDDETGSPHPITDQWAGLAKLMAPNAVVVGAALARSLESDLAAANDEITRLRAEVEAKQARIDALMLEHCPDEMTQEQTDNWKAHQRPREG